MTCRRLSYFFSFCLFKETQTTFGWTYKSSIFTLDILNNLFWAPEIPDGSQQRFQSEKVSSRREITWNQVSSRVLNPTDQSQPRLCLIQREARWGTRPLHISSRRWRGSSACWPGTPQRAAWSWVDWSLTFTAASEEDAQRPRRSTFPFLPRVPDGGGEGRRYGNWARWYLVCPVIQKLKHLWTFVSRHVS